MKLKVEMQMMDDGDMQNKMLILYICCLKIRACEVLVEKAGKMIPFLLQAKEMSINKVQLF